MDSYTGFSTTYEQFMDNIPYDKWADYLTAVLKKYGMKEGLVCELGCGTGEMTRRLRDRGYDMIGIDLSADMLEVAMYDHYEENEGILYLNQDMREMELYGTVGAFVSVCDSMNYLLTEEDFEKTLRLANNYLEKDGLFVFDLKTVHEYRDVMGNRMITDLREDGCLVWDNRFDEKTNENHYDITVFSLCDEEEDIYERIDENHVQKAYEVDKVKEMIENAGMEFVAVFDAFTFEEPTENSERLYFVAKEKRQEGKLYV